MSNDTKNNFILQVLIFLIFPFLPFAEEIFGVRYFFHFDFNQSFMMMRQL